MHINSAERSIICKLCYRGPDSAPTAELLSHLYQHFSAHQGEHTAFDKRSFPPREVLEDEMSEDEMQQFIENAEESMDASYEELVDGGELVWFRTRLAKATAADQFAVFVDAFAVSDSGDSNTFRDLAMKDVDGVVFVADPDDREATVDAWAALQKDWSGPVVLLVHGTEFTDEVEEWLDFEGEAFAEPGGFDDSKMAFESAAKMSLRHARSSS